MARTRLARQMRFIVELDRLKRVLRRTSLITTARRENDAEHSWHLAAMAVLLAEYAPAQITDLLRVVAMCLLHDVVEIDAGDTFCYDAVGARTQAAREQKAARRIFALLPADQASACRELWEEFEEGATPEARYAAALDRLQPLLLNYHSRGTSWKKHGVSLAQIISRCAPIGDACPALRTYVQGLIDDAVRQGFVPGAGPHRPRARRGKTPKRLHR